MPGAVMPSIGSDAKGKPGTLALDARSNAVLTRSVETAAAESEGLDAFRRFCTPRLSARRAPDHDKLVERARFHLRSAARRVIHTCAGEIATYEMAPDEPVRGSVLLVHGWSGEAAFMGAFGDFLKRRGFRTVLMDLPGHGLSSGTQVSLIDCARAVLETAEAAGPFRFAIGHSIGAMAALMAGEGHAPLPRSYPFDSYVLVSMPDAFADITREFGREANLSAAAQRVFERELERLARRRIQDFTGTNLLRYVGRPSLLLHSRDDAEVGFRSAEAMCACCSDAKLEAFDGFGHRAILYAPPAVRAAAAFLSRR